MCVLEGVTEMKEEKIEEIKTKKDLFKNIFVDCVVGIFLIAGMWTITHGLLLIYQGFYEAKSLPSPSSLGDTLFWFIEGIFFIFLAFETRKYRKIKLG
jgi:hypothetical protein